jgi:predicted nicotinamide N-methyase
VTIQSNSLVDALSQLLPAAKLEWQTLSFDQKIELQLLSLKAEALQLDAQQIGVFWQQLPYWAFAWAAGQGLAEYILSNPETVKDKRVLDFGCGSGLVGIAAALAGAKSVVCCDTDPLALLASQENAMRNNVVIEVAKDWQQLDGKFDCLLAADVLYDLTSVGDLSLQCAEIPHWLVAETQYQLPPWSDLSKVGSTKATTLPILEDFDQDLDVSIYLSQ